MSEPPSAQPRRTGRNGTLFVLGLGVCMFLGWLLYQQYLPAQWLRDFGGEIAARAALDPTPPEPEDVRQTQRREPAEHPYICAGEVIHTPWDRMVVVTSHDDILTHPILADAAWGDISRDAMAAQMKSDPRYQLIVLMRESAVLDAQLFFTFWGDLKALARPQGFARNEAVFTAYSDDGIYVVAPATTVPPSACATP